MIHFIHEVNEGLDGTSIKAGIIGRLGVPGRLLLDGGTQSGRCCCQRNRVCTLSPSRQSANSCAQILDIIASVDLDPNRVILCHMDRTFPSGEGIEALLDTGANVEWDFFGIEQSYYWMGNVELPNDYSRLRQIKKFVDVGYSDQILISHDICTKTRLRSFGGHGYSHIIRNIPELLVRLDFDVSLLDKLINENPKNILSFEEL